MMMESYYHLAQKMSGFREAFLLQFDMGEYSSFVSRIAPAAENSGRMVMSTGMDPDAPGLSVITVYPQAFHMKYPGDFFAILRYHEGRHAQQSAQGRKQPGEVNSAEEIIWRIEKELDAYHNERRNMAAFHHSEFYEYHVDSEIRDYTESLMYMNTDKIARIILPLREKMRARV